MPHPTRYRCARTLAHAAGASLILLPLATASAQRAGGEDRSTDHDRPENGRRSSLVQRTARPFIETHAGPPQPGVLPLPAIFPFEIRSIDGTGNNILNPIAGVAGTPFIRLAPNNYSDGIATPAAGLPSARAVSNAIHAQTGSILNPRNASDYLWQWGQFLDHDIDETPIADPAEAFDVAVPMGDIFFDPTNSGTETIPLDRSAWLLDDGVRQQINNITAYVDASNVYGSETHRADELRMNDGSGRLKTSAGNLLPFNTAGLDNAPTGADPSFFLAGDVRANEQNGLIAMHTLFVREHNRLCAEFKSDDPALTGEELYQIARAVVGGQMQAITYGEFLPLLLGPGALGPPGYDPMVDASIANEFATAAYRVGHTMLSSTLLRLDSNNDEITEGHLSLADAFFDPAKIQAVGIDPVLRGLAQQEAQNIDRHIIDEVRNFLFGPPGAGGFDLASLNIQRGRDHGLPTYNDLRGAMGMPVAVSFGDITPDPSVLAALTSVYGDVDDVDAWSGMLSEPHVPGGLVGPTLRRVLADQFERLRDGDRFWYRTYLPPPLRNLVDQSSLARIIRRNTDIGNELPSNVFIVPECNADFDGDGDVTITDLLDYLSLWYAADPQADIVPPAGVNIQDLLTFVSAWFSGC